MKQILGFLKLIRIWNLLFIALTQYLIRYAVFKPILESESYQLQISDLHFFLLSLATVMIAAGGNVINDYFDLKIDRVNKPDKLVVGTIIKRRVAMGAHMTITFIGLLIALMTSFVLDLPQFSGIYVAAAVLLWFYSFYLKKKPLIGNIVIAALAAMVPLIVPLYELPYLHGKYLDAGSFGPLMWWAIAYAFFAFCFTLAREITKDISDVPGDEKYGCKTLPIVFGETAAKNFVIFIYMFTGMSLFYIQQHTDLQDNTTLSYMVAFIFAPTVYLIYITYVAEMKYQLERASLVNKLVSLFGILYLLLANYMIQNGPPF